MKQLNKKLNKIELNYLSAFLDANDLMPIINLHGFLTAVVSAPEPSTPSQWFDGIGIDEVEFKSEAEANKYFSLLIRFYNGIVSDFEKNKFSPLLFTETKGKKCIDEALTMAAPWCIGYIEGVHWDEDSWLDRENEEKSKLARMLFCIISIFLSDEELCEELEEAELDVDPKEFRICSLMSLPSIVTEIYELIRKNAVNPHVENTSVKKTGRNEICPCGSNKKYKKCCALENEMIH